MPSAFERKLFVIRKLVENRIRAERLDPERRFHVSSLSSETIVYKGLMLPAQLASFYQDLQDEDVQSGLALVHSRFSTNTFPTWHLAQPFRVIAHNGEINTLKGNLNWMKAHETRMSTPVYGEQMEAMKPIVQPGGSDSAALDTTEEGSMSQVGVEAHTLAEAARVDGDAPSGRQGHGAGPAGERLVRHVGQASAQSDEGGGERGGHRPLMLVHRLADGAGLAGRPRDVEQHQHREVASTPAALHVEVVVVR